MSLSCHPVSHNQATGAALPIGGDAITVLARLGSLVAKFRFRRPGENAGSLVHWHLALYASSTAHEISAIRFNVF